MLIRGSGLQRLDWSTSGRNLRPRQCLSEQTMASADSLYASGCHPTLSAGCSTKTSHATCVLAGMLSKGSAARGWGGPASTPSQNDLTLPAIHFRE